MRRHEILIGFLLATAVWAVVTVLQSDSSMLHQICETNQYTEHENCTSHHVLYVAFWYIRWVINSVTIATAATVAVAIFTYTLKRSTDNLWKAGNDQLTFLSNEFNATHRPWVKVDRIQIASDLIFENGEGRIDLLVTVSNKGYSPGLRVRVNAKIVASNQIILLQEQATFSAAFKREPLQNELIPELTSWPGGDTIHFSVTAWLNSVDMPRFKPLADNTPFPITLLAIVGCVDYEFSFFPGHHQTGLIYAIRKSTPYPGVADGIEGAVRLEGRIAQNDLAISIPFDGTGPVD